MRCAVWLKQRKLSRHCWAVTSGLVTRRDLVIKDSRDQRVAAGTTAIDYSVCKKIIPFGKPDLVNTVCIRGNASDHVGDNVELPGIKKHLRRTEGLRAGAEACKRPQPTESAHQPFLISGVKPLPGRRNMVSQTFKAALPFCVFPRNVAQCIAHEFQEPGGSHIPRPFQSVCVLPACLHRRQQAVRRDKCNLAAMMAAAQGVKRVERRQSAANHYDAAIAVDGFRPVAAPWHSDE